jgi:hypothetical protein
MHRHPHTLGSGDCGSGPAFLHPDFGQEFDRRRQIRLIFAEPWFQDSLVALLRRITFGPVSTSSPHGFRFELPSVRFPQDGAAPGS